MPGPDNDFEAPESTFWRKLVRNVSDEMPGHVGTALALAAFLFFHGMAGSVFKTPAAT